MNKEIFEVENIKCNGCMNTIKNSIHKHIPDAEIAIDLETQTITIESNAAIDRLEINTQLASNGYPEKGNNTLLNKAKSYVSCAIGKMDN